MNSFGLIVSAKKKNAPTTVNNPVFPAVRSARFAKSKTDVEKRPTRTRGPLPSALHGLDHVFPLEGEKLQTIRLGVAYSLGELAASLMIGEGLSGNAALDPIGWNCSFSV